MKNNKIVKIIKNTVLNDFWFKILFMASMLLSASPFIHLVIAPFIKIFLAWGMVILIYQAITQKKRYMNIYSLLMGLFVASYGITVFINRDMNFTSNIKTWLYMIVILFVVFSINPCESKQKIFSEIKGIIWVFTLISFVLALISFGTFVFSIKGHGVYESQWVYYGMFENRLWGLYNPSTGSALDTISILLITGYWIYFRPKKKMMKVLMSIELIVHYFCLLLTNSRTALYTLLIGVAIIIFLGMGYYSKETRFSAKKLGKQILFALAGCVVLLVAVNPIREGLSYIPGTVKIVIRNDNGEKKNDKKDEFEKEELTRLEELENRPGGILTGRTELWKAGFETFKESPVFGIARENVSERVCNNLADDYWLRDLQRGGLHNIYITVLVCSGIVGFILFAAVLLMFVIRCVQYVFTEKIRQNGGIPLIILPVIAVQLIMEFLEARILYQVNIFYILFWCMAGYVLYFLNQTEKDITDEA